MTRRQAPEPDGQLDLFGEVEAREAAATARVQRQAAFVLRACFHPDGTPVVWTAPWDCSDGTPKGAQRPGWRCWHCGQVEVNEYLLRTNHGLDADQEECPPGSGGCASQMLLAAQERSRQWKAQQRLGATRGCTCTLGGPYPPVRFMDAEGALRSRGCPLHDPQEEP